MSSDTSMDPTDPHAEAIQRPDKATPVDYGNASVLGQPKTTASSTGVPPIPKVPGQHETTKLGLGVQSTRTTSPAPTGAPPGTSLISGTNYIAATGSTESPAYDAKSGGMTIPGTTAGGGSGAPLTQGMTPADNAALTKQALGPGVAVGVANLAGYDKNGAPITTAPPTRVGGGTPAPADENPAFQVFRQNLADSMTRGAVTPYQAQNASIGPGGIAIFPQSFRQLPNGEMERIQ